MTLFLLVVSSKVYAASDENYIPDVYSPEYDGSYESSVYSHFGYYYIEDNPKWYDTETINIYSDLYIRDYFKVSYYGLIGTPQMTFFTDYSIMYTGAKQNLTEISYHMNEEMIHNTSLTVGISIEVGELEGVFGPIWSNTTRYANNVKFTVELEDNSNEDPMVIMPVYKDENC